VKVKKKYLVKGISELSSKFHVVVGKTDRRIKIVFLVKTTKMIFRLDLQFDLKNHLYEVKLEYFQISVL
jgi:hypothetical protein